MTVFTGRTALLAILLVMAAGPLAGQAVPGAFLRGTAVADDSGERLAYALVMLEPGFGRRFAAENGSFVITGIEPGSYRLQVRQVGFRPFDSTVVVGPETPALRIVLVRLAIQLPPVAVGAVATCRRPGPPDTANVALTALFEQLKSNAERHLVLQDQYPFTYAIERVLSYRFAGGAIRSERDTLRYSSAERWPYQPGRMVRPDRNRAGRSEIRDPALADLADPGFQATHCFSLGPLDTLEGSTWVRIDFRVAEWLRYTDVDGSAFLDTASYQVRHIRFRITNTQLVSPSINSLTAQTSFSAVRPNLLVMDRLHAVTSLSRGRGLDQPVELVERQRLLGVEFLRPPGAAGDSVPP